MRGKSQCKGLAGCDTCHWSTDLSLYMHFQMVPAWATWEADIEGDSPRGGRVKREGWERKPRPTCVHAATSYPWAQREKRTFYSPREGAVCSAELSCGTICTAALGLWFIGWENACVEEKNSFSWELLPLVNVVPQTQFINPAVSPPFLCFRSWGFSTHTCMSVSKLKCMTPFLISKVCLHAHFELFS